MINEDVRPKKLNLHELLVRKTAVKVMKPEGWVESIISFEKKEANKATQLHNTVEISGFGKFYLSRNKLVKRITTVERILGHLEAKEASPERDRKIAYSKVDLEYYYKRLKSLPDVGYKRNNGGDKEYLSTPEGVEGSDRAGILGEDVDLQSVSL